MIRIFCTPRAWKNGKKSKHRVHKRCEAVKKILAMNPGYGVVVSRFPRFRKMRINLPHASLGKRGGYRLIYKAQLIDEVSHVVLSAIYFKGEKEDLEDAEYEKISIEADEIFGDPLEIDWEEVETPKEGNST